MTHNEMCDAERFRVLREERRGLEAKNKRLRAALEPFAGFCVWLEAAAEVGEIDPLGENACIVSLSVAGGSNYIWMHQLREAVRILEATE